MKNMEIRKKILESGVRQWMIADWLGITETTFSKKLRKELTDEEKGKVLKAIQTIKLKKSEAK